MDEHKENAHTSMSVSAQNGFSIKLNGNKSFGYTVYMYHPASMNGSTFVSSTAGTPLSRFGDMKSSP